MTGKRYDIVLCRSEHDRLTLEALAARTKIHPDLVERFVEYGLIEPIEWIGPMLLFDAAIVPRLRMIMRLRSDIGANLAGIGIILDLLERVRTFQRENEWLRVRYEDAGQNSGKGSGRPRIRRIGSVFSSRQLEDWLVWT